MDPLSGTGWTTSQLVGDAVWMRVEDQSAVAAARRRATGLAERLGFTGEPMGRVQLAVTEAATNLVKHAERGEMLLRLSRQGDDAAFEFVCFDRGPGVADVPGARLDGYSTTGTLGVGLGAIDRIADRSGMHSASAAGTVLFARFLQSDGGASVPDLPFAGLTRPIEGEEECGDAYAARLHEGTVYAMLCDGLGHGPLAARAPPGALQEKGRAAGRATR
ncbi:ATP-binding protein [Spirillospora sp. NPDC049652]